MVMQNNVPIGRMEFVDPKSIYVINNYSGSINTGYGGYLEMPQKACEGGIFHVRAMHFFS